MTLSNISQEKEDFIERSRNKTILMIEDMPEVREILTHDLQTCGYQGKIIQASSLAEAKKTLIEENVSLILLDKNLPGTNGIKILEGIKGHSEYKKIHVVIVSAESGVESVLEALELGALDYLIKPWTQDELFYKIYFSLKA
jgi:response regulator of citrate/malate metabolism